MSTRTISIRSSWFAPLLLLALTPAIHAQVTDNIALVCSGTACDPFTFIPAAQQFDNVDDAVMFALDTTNDVDTVQILEGTWPFIGNFPIDLAITIEGIGHPASVIVQKIGMGSNPPMGPVFDCVVPGITIEGLTIMDGDTAGIRVFDADTIINRCYIFQNDGDGILVEGDSAPVIANCSIVGHAGAGLSLSSTSATNTEIVHCTFTENDMGVLASAGLVRIQNSLFESNITSGIESAVATVSGGTNNFFGNTTDYVGLAALPGDTSVGPNLFVPPPSLVWVGQIDPTAPVVDTANDLSADADVGSFLLLDLDGDVRPIGVMPDIGADEGGFGIRGAVVLVDASYFPPAIGELDAGDLSIVLQFAGYDGTLISFDDAAYTSSLSDKVVLWPESLEYDDSQLNVPDINSIHSTNAANYSVPLNFDRISDGYFVGTNAIPVDSDLRTVPITATIEPGFGFDTTQFYLDGESWLTIVINDQKLTIAQMLVDDVADRRPLIDTHPPQLYIEPTLTGLKPGNFVTDRLITGPGNDDDSAALISGDPRVGSNSGIPGVYPFSDDWTFTQFEEIEATPIGRGPAVFYNAGADYSVGGPQNLSHTVSAQFVDIPPLDSTGDPIDLITPAGFQPELFVDFALPQAITLDELTGTTSNGYFMPRWLFSTGRSKLAASEVEATPLVINATFVDPGPLAVGTGFFDGLTATWDLTDLGYNIANNISDPFRFSFQFVGVDAAFNIQPVDDLLDPLNVWWLLRTNSQLTPYMNTEVDRPSFTWRLKRGADTGLENTTEPARPLFAYRFLRSINPLDRDGPYAPVRGGGLVPTTVLNNAGWSPSYTYAQGLNFQWFEQNGFTTTPGLVNSWLILVVSSIDEAGNVEELPWDPTLPDFVGPGGMRRLSSANPLNPFNQELYTLDIPAGVNWQRFLIRGAGSSLDTGDLNGSVTATFWHESTTPVNGQIDGGEAVFDQSNIIPLPPSGFFNPNANNGNLLQRTQSGFTVAYVDTSAAGGTYNIAWVLERDGVKIAQGVLVPTEALIADPFATGSPAVTGTAAIRLPRTPGDPGTEWNVPEEYLGDGDRTRSVNYIFKAATVRSVGGVVLGDLAMGTDGYIDFEASGGAVYLIDDTPVNYAFTVTPDIREFIENKTSTDNQPVKVIEGN